MSGHPDGLPPDLVTHPDQVDPVAREQVSLLHGERILRCWRVPFGYLLMTNLRCVYLWCKLELFARSEWHSSPTFFFYNLSPPHVIAGRFVELSEAYDEGTGSARFLIHDAAAVREEIESARVAGRAEWTARRARAQGDLRHLSEPAPPPGTTVIVREVVKVRCAYCGNLMDEGRSTCPSCGAPQT